MDPHSIIIVSLHTPKEKLCSEVFARKVGRPIAEYLAQFA